MEQDINTFISEMTQLRSELTRIGELLTRYEKPKKTKEERPPLPHNPKVSKDEAAAILLVSPRQLQRIRKKIGLKWRMEGRESMYFLESIVNAICNYQLPWNPAVYDQILNRITKLPIMPSL